MNETMLAHVEVHHCSAFAELLTMVCNQQPIALHEFYLSDALTQLLRRTPEMGGNDQMQRRNEAILSK